MSRKKKTEPKEEYENHMEYSERYLHATLFLAVMVVLVCFGMFIGFFWSMGCRKVFQSFSYAWDVFLQKSWYNLDKRG